MYIFAIILLMLWSILSCGGSTMVLSFVMVTVCFTQDHVIPNTNQKNKL